MGDGAMAHDDKAEFDTPEIFAYNNAKALTPE